jgi:hypothetical protein
VHPNNIDSSAAAESNLQGGAMANFAVNPLAFIPPGMSIDHGPADRRVRSVLVVDPVPPLHHDNLVIAEPSHFMPIHMRQDLRDTIEGLLVEDGFTVRRTDDHPFGLGTFTLSDTLVVDTVVGMTLQINDLMTITFVKLDQARNRRLASFGRETWVLFLGFPADYQTSFYINKAMDDFGLLSLWHRPREHLKYVLVKVAVTHPKFIPKSLIITQLGGARNSWTVPVYILRSSDWNAHVHDLPPPDEDPEPTNRNPHPFYGLEQSAEQIYQQQLTAWLQQNV